MRGERGDLLGRQRNRAGGLNRRLDAFHARVTLAAWLQADGKDAKGDLGDLLKIVPIDCVGIKSAAGIINRLHPRGKSAEQEKQARQGRQLRDVCDEDAKLSISLIGFLLREFEWGR
jgi:hypothetical protein